MATLTSSPPTTGVELVGLAKSFGAVQAVERVDISLARGETVALLGPNGAGKSTIIDMLLAIGNTKAAAASPCNAPVTIFCTAPKRVGRGWCPPPT